MMLVYSRLKKIIQQFHSGDLHYSDLSGLSKSWEMTYCGKRILSQGDAELILSILDHAKNPSIDSYILKCFPIKGLYGLASRSLSYHQEANMEFAFYESDDIHDAFRSANIESGEHQEFIRDYNEANIIDKEKILSLRFSEALNSSERKAIEKYLRVLINAKTPPGDNNPGDPECVLILLTAFMNYIQSSPDAITKREREFYLINILTEARSANGLLGSCMSGVKDRLVLGVSKILNHMRSSNDYYERLVTSCIRPLIKEEVSEDGMIIRPSELLIAIFIISTYRIDGVEKQYFFTLKRDFISDTAYRGVFEGYCDRKRTISGNIFSDSDRQYLESLPLLDKKELSLGIASKKRAYSLEEAETLLNDIKNQRDTTLSLLDDSIAESDKKVLLIKRRRVLGIINRLTGSIESAKQFESLPTPQKHKKLQFDLEALQKASETIEEIEERIPGCGFLFAKRTIDVLRVHREVFSDDEAFERIQSMIPFGFRDLLDLFPHGSETLKEYVRDYIDAKRSPLFEEGGREKYLSSFFEYTENAKKTQLAILNDPNKPLLSIKIDTLGGHLHRLFVTQVRIQGAIWRDLADLSVCDHLGVNGCLDRFKQEYSFEKISSLRSVANYKDLYLNIKTLFQAMDHFKIDKTDKELIDYFEGVFALSLDHNQVSLALLLSKHFGFKADKHFAKSIDSKGFCSIEHAMFILYYFNGMTIPQVQDIIIDDKERFIKAAIFKMMTTTPSLNQQPLSELIRPKITEFFLKINFREYMYILRSTLWPVVKLIGLLSIYFGSCLLLTFMLSFIVSLTLMFFNVFILGNRALITANIFFVYSIIVLPFCFYIPVKLMSMISSNLYISNLFIDAIAFLISNASTNFKLLTIYSYRKTMDFFSGLFESFYKQKGSIQLSERKRVGVLKEKVSKKSPLKSLLLSYIKPKHNPASKTTHSKKTFI